MNGESGLMLNGHRAQIVMQGIDQPIQHLDQPCLKMITILP